MTNFVGIFPLGITVFPGEALNLHVFEPRYKQLINDCITEGKNFGIPTVINGQIAELGTLIEITELVKTYDTGELDLKTRGVSVFRILQVVEEVPEKMYKGAIVNYPENKLDRGSAEIANLVHNEVKRLFSQLAVTEKFKDPALEIVSYDIAHFIGLKLEQEYELIGLFSETQRLEYIRRYLKVLLPTMKELEDMKERAARNGHFQNLSLNL